MLRNRENQAAGVDGWFCLFSDGRRAIVEASDAALREAVGTFCFQSSHQRINT
ncbi:MAG: hypothetical protein IJ242_13670 [Clostridia bacterium]|nr:hypothetical protein [Clostridia bacterium]